MKFAMPGKKKHTETFSVQHRGRNHYYSFIDLSPSKSTIVSVVEGGGYPVSVRARIAENLP